MAPKVPTSSPTSLRLSDGDVTEGDCSVSDRQNEIQKSFYYLRKIKMHI